MIVCRSGHWSGEEERSEQVPWAGHLSISASLKEEQQQQVCGHKCTDEGRDRGRMATSWEKSNITSDEWSSSGPVLFSNTAIGSIYSETLEKPGLCIEVLQIQCLTYTLQDHFKNDCSMRSLYPNNLCRRAHHIMSVLQGEWRHYAVMWRWTQMFLWFGKLEQSRLTVKCCICCVLMHNLFVPLQRAGLHPGLQRQGGCRRLALGTEGKSVSIMWGGGRGHWLRRLGNRGSNPP